MKNKKFSGSQKSVHSSFVMATSMFETIICVCKCVFCVSKYTYTYLKYIRSGIQNISVTLFSPEKLEQIGTNFDVTFDLLSVFPSKLQEIMGHGAPFERYSHDRTPRRRLYEMTSQKTHKKLNRYKIN